MASGAGNSQSHCSACDNIDSIINDVVSDPQKSATKCEKPHRRLCATILRRRLVGSNLQQQKLVIRKILIEGVDDPVTVGRGVDPEPFFPPIDVAFGIRITGNIQPVTCPLLTVLRRIEKAFDQFFIGVWRGIVHERFNLFERGRQASQIKSHAANQSSSIGWW